MAIHKHGRRESNPYYRETLNRLIKNNLMDSVGIQEILMEIAKIKELNRDVEFLDMLFQRFNETALHGYGFRRENGVSNGPQHSSSVEKMHAQPSSTNLNNSQVRTNTNVPPFPNKTLQVPTASSTNIHSSSLKKVDSQANINTINVNPQMQTPNMPIQSQTPTAHMNNYVAQQQQPVPILAEPTLVSRLNLSAYPCPHPSSPLSEHLSRLSPPND
jgi:hypothetical protein